MARVLGRVLEAEKILRLGEGGKCGRRLLPEAAMQHGRSGEAEIFSVESALRSWRGGLESMVVVLIMVFLLIARVIARRKSIGSIGIGRDDKAESSIM